MSTRQKCSNQQNKHYFPIKKILSSSHIFPLFTAMTHFSLWFRFSRITCILCLLQNMHILLYNRKIRNTNVLAFLKEVHANVKNTFYKDLLITKCIVKDWLLFKCLCLSLSRIITVYVSLDNFSKYLIYNSTIIFTVLRFQTSVIEK